MSRRTVISHDQPIGLDTPLRLDVAAELGFPAGGRMTAAGLRTEWRRGKLAIERIAGKDYTTLRAIEEMRALCRSVQKVPASISELAKETSDPRGSSETETDRSALDSLFRNVEKLKSGSPLTLLKSTNRADKKSVIQLRSK
jgi:hypothetical protein